MGQEASLPTEGRGGDGLEEQAKAPPSSINPSDTNSSSSPTRSGAAKSNRKNFIFRHGGGGNDSFEQRESARAAASAGNIYQQNGDGGDGNSDDDFTLQKMPEPPGATFFQPHNRAAAAMEEAAELQHLQHQQNIGGSHETGGGKKGLFPSRPSARGMINSMRNLSIGAALRKQKEITDWEKQWDEDEDEDSDEEEEDQKQLMDEQQHLSSSSISSTPPPAVAGAISHRGAPRSPKPAVVTEDLLALPNQRQQQLQQQHHHLAMDWDTTATVQPAVAVADRKPDVTMFLPMLRVLGKGSFGKVVLVQKRQGKERGQLFAMKILKKSHLVKRRQIDRTRTERKVLSVVNHPFIMKLHYAFQTPDKLYLVLDYCPGGELFFHLSRFRRFPERVARFYAAELLLAIGHLHKRGIIYRDMKPENVLLDAEGHVKLGDFGLAKTGISHPYEGATSMCGTPEYMSPEILAQMGHGFCVDYWGLGMIVYEMMTGLPPWYTTDRNQLFRRLKSAPLDIPSYFSSAAANCVASLLERNPRRRLGVTGIRAAMEHEYFRSISWRSLYSRKVEAPVRPCEGWKPPEAVKEGMTQHVRAQSSPNARPLYPDGVAKLDANDLDTATQNFDNQFLRMPVESDDQNHESSADDNENMEDLNEETFLGFTFDVVKNKEEAAAQQQQQQQQQGSSSPVRNRTQNHHTTNNNFRHPA